MEVHGDSNGVLRGEVGSESEMGRRVIMPFNKF